MCVNLLALAGASGSIERAGALQAGGNVLNAIASLAGGVGARTAANAEADMARMQGDMKARQIRRAALKETGSARAAAAASGVSVGSGSVLEAERDIARYSEQDALTAIITGQATASRAKAEGKAYALKGMVGAQESLLDAADAWRRTRRTRARSEVRSSGVSEDLNNMDWR